MFNFKRFLWCRGLVMVPAVLFTLAAPLQAQEGPLVLYTFEEGDGFVVRDMSGVGDPLDLTISDPGAVQWLSGGGLAINANVLIASDFPASKVFDAVQLTQELTVEAWVIPDNLTQQGPARVVTMSVSTSFRNFTLGQQGPDWHMRLRTSTGTVSGGIPGGNGIPEFSAGPNTVETRLTHLVFTRDAFGTDMFYIDGELVATRTDLGGDFFGWDPGFHLALGNELTADRGWLGELHRVAIYDYALDAEQVKANFDAETEGLPVIVTQPEGRRVEEGESVTLSVVVDPESGPPFTYQWRFEGVDIGGATESTYTIPSFQGMDAGRYSVVVSNAAGSTTSFTAVLTLAGGLVALYTFEEGSGNTVQDVSGIGTALNLTIANPANISWIPGGGISINQPTLLASPGAATKIIEACQESNELSVEVWARTRVMDQSGPARLVTMAPSPSARNMTLGQQLDQWVMRVRTTGGTVAGGVPGGNGVPQFDAGAGTVETRLMHIVFTRDAFGTDVFYVDGVLVATRTSLTGDFSGWNTGYRFGLGAEIDNTRHWLGELHYVAVYNQALTAGEVAENFDARALKLDVVDVQPADGTHFHPAQEGLQFRAVALAGNVIAQQDVRLTLNGEDVSGALQFSGSSTDWQVTYPALEPNQNYQAEIEVRDDQDNTRTVVLVFDTFTLREDGLVVLYTFEEGGGTVVQDRAEAGNPLDLTIDDPSLVRWLEGGGLGIDGNVLISSATVATKVMQPVQQNNAISLVAWVRSTNPDLSLARVVTISEFRQFFPGSEVANDLRNISLIQEGNTYEGYLRTTETDITGRPPLASPELPLFFPMHVVYTRDAGGQTTLYVNGEAVSSDFAGGDLSNWFEGFRLAIGRELNEVAPQGPAAHRFRHWEGELYRVAIYHKALSAGDVQADFEEFGGDDTTPPTVPENLAATAGASFVHLTWDPSTDESDRVFYEVERNGEIIASFLMDNAYLDQSVAAETSYTYRVRALDFLQNASDFSAAVNVSTSALAEAPGLVRAEFYTGITGTLVSALTGAPNYPFNPDATLFLPSVETPQNWGDNYGVRVSGWFVPPQTGDYVFLMASDHDGEFWLSTDDTPGNLLFLMFDAVQSAFRDWTGTANRPGFEFRSDTNPWSQMPGLIPLIGGQSYYFEARMKEGTGADHIGVTYKLWDEPDPANGTPSRMTGDVIRGLVDPAFVPPVIQTQPQSQAVAFGESITLRVELTELSSRPASYQWRFQGNDIPGATEATYTIESFQLEDAGTYSVEVSNIAGTTTSELALLRAPGLGLLALYMFDEPGGTTVRDVSGVGEPLDLIISDPNAVRWLEGGGLAVDDDSVLIVSPGAATKIFQACQESNELTVEAWVTPANLFQEGPARIVTLSPDTSNRNFTLGQQFDTWQMRTRVPATGVNATGGPGGLSSAAGTVELRLTHLVFTRDVSGNETIYIDGQAVASRAVAGDFSNWNAGYRLGIANELTADRGWLGEFHRVAIYRYALNAGEVEENFEAGPQAPPPVVEEMRLLNPSIAGNTFSFEFATVTGQSYVVEYADSLLQSPWVPLQTIDGDGTVRTIEDAIPGGAVSRYYRLRRQ